MLPEPIIEKILARYGKDKIYSADCAVLAADIGLGETTLKRMFGLVGKKSPERSRAHHTSTMDILAKWLGYENYRDLLSELGENDDSSEFPSLESINVRKLDTDTRLIIKWEPSRVIKITYCGDNKFIVDESINSKLMKGDIIKLSHLILGLELLAKEVWRDGRLLGPFRGAKQGGITSMELI